MLIVVLFKVFSTLCGANARYAEVVSVSVVQPSAVACVALAPAVHASTRPFIKALAQHALAADAASRRARSGLFSAPVSATMGRPSISGGAAKAQPVRRLY